MSIKTTNYMKPIFNYIKEIVSLALVLTLAISCESMEHYKPDISKTSVYTIDVIAITDDGGVADLKTPSSIDLYFNEGLVIEANGSSLVKSKMYDYVDSSDDISYVLEFSTFEQRKVADTIVPELYKYSYSLNVDVALGRGELTVEVSKDSEHSYTAIYEVAISKAERYI